MPVGRWYPSKVDRWLLVVLAIAPLVTLGATLPSPGAGKLIGLATTAVLAAVYLGLVFPMRYGIDSEHLVVRHGLVRQRVPLAKIIEVYPTRSPLSSPALSLDRICIKYGTGIFKEFMISPAARGEFLDELAAATGLRRDGDRLVR